MAKDIYMERILREKAVYWKCIGRDKHGQPIYDAPVEIKCRWEDQSKLFLNAQGQEEVSRAEVMVDRKIPLDSVLWFGSLNQVSYLTEPLRNEDAWHVRYFKRIPTRNGKKFVRIATL